jgi:hypothetical protein
LRRHLTNVVLPSAPSSPLPPQAGGHKLKRSLTKEPALPSAADIAAEKYAVAEAVVAVGGVSGTAAAPAAATASK